MGRKKTGKLIVLIVIFLITSFAAYYSPTLIQRVGQVTLNTFLKNIEGYQAGVNVALEPETTRFLELDDYTYTSYRNSDGAVELYVGYYYTADKVSAAHSPLACFPGQGWIITQPVFHSLSLGNGQTVHYAELIASIEEQKELIFYWYQAYQSTTPHVYLNKINTLYNKYRNDQEQHAFVRVSVSFTKSTEEKAREQGLEFIKNFYPAFIKFTEQNGLAPLPHRG